MPHAGLRRHYERGEDQGRLHRRQQEKIIDEAGGAHPYVDAFVGKAWPETFERMLALPYQYREAFVFAYGKSRTEPYKTCAEILSADANQSVIA